MTVYFANAGLIDLDVLRVMGVSVKETKSPIGYFGTGLKFAIAVLLRTDHRVILRRGAEIYRFEKRELVVRGKQFHQIYMNEEALPFTTELGRNWQVWQAYRELHSNTLDEVGKVSDQPLEADTVFEVDGAEMQLEYDNRAAIFLETKPLVANEFVEVHSRPSRYVYYRGVRAGHAKENLLFTYNLLCPMQLSEDRELDIWHVQFKLASLLPRLDHRGFFMQLLSRVEHLDQKLDFSICGMPSESFLDTARSLYSDQRSSPSARLMVDRDTHERGEYTPVRLSTARQQMWDQALEHLGFLGAALSSSEVQVVESLGAGVWGIWHRERNMIYIAATTLDHGLETLVATLYEEWIHKYHGLEDETRAMQNFLLQRLTALILETKVNTISLSQSTI